VADGVFGDCEREEVVSGCVWVELEMSLSFTGVVSLGEAMVIAFGSGVVVVVVLGE
jgi:hypothetical protein